MNKLLTFVDRGLWSVLRQPQAAQLAVAGQALAIYAVFPLALVLAGCGGGSSDNGGGIRAGIVFQTTFDCPEWKQSDGLNDADVCATGDGIAGFGNWTVLFPAGEIQEDEITSPANYSGGDGGRGFRHYRANGIENNNGGGLLITLPAAESEVWVRFYMRYSPGFAWDDPGNPTYAKEHYWNVQDDPYLVYGIQGTDAGGIGSWGLHYNGVENFPSSLNWQQSQGGIDVGDDQWHCHEYHWKRNGAGSTVEIWVDRIRYLNRTVNLGTGGYDYFALGSNQSTPASSCNSPICYTDYDDLVISNSARVGCLP